LRNSRFSHSLSWVIYADSSHLLCVSALLSKLLPIQLSTEGSGKMNAYLNLNPCQEARPLPILASMPGRVSGSDKLWFQFHSLGKACGCGVQQTNSIHLLAAADSILL
jgi:hypothetical protein